MPCSPRRRARWWWSVRTYDENQLSARRLTCAGCGKEFYMRPPHVRCVECRGWQPVATFSNERPERKTDVNGNQMDGP